MLSIRSFSKTLAVSAAILLISGGAAYAQSSGGFTSHHLVDKKPYAHKAEKLPSEDKLELREYLDYEQREPCQFYRPVPQGFMRDGCRVVAIEPPKPAPVIEQPAPAPAPEPPPSPVLVDYKIFFDFDKATINPGAETIINQIANEITRYNPSDVTVAGHTDTAGPSEYNRKLSLRRAQAVSDALTAKGVANRVINLEAHGQEKPAVQTPDGVAQPENRRVVVEFIR